MASDQIIPLPHFTPCHIVPHFTFLHIPLPHFQRPRSARQRFGTRWTPKTVDLD